MKIRIYTENSIAANEVVALDSGNSHHVSVVLRRKIGDTVYLFNGSGEYECNIQTVSKNSVMVKVVQIVRQPNSSKGYGITFFCPVVKKDTMLLMVRQVAEMGVDKISFFSSNRSPKMVLKPIKIISKVVQAIEQSEQLKLPEIRFDMGLKDILQQQKQLVCFSEIASRENITMSDSDIKKIGQCTDVGIIIGPEGGFNKEETALLRSGKNVVFASLGKNILTTETAAIAALQTVKNIIN